MISRCEATGISFGQTAMPSEFAKLDYAIRTMEFSSCDFLVAEISVLKHNLFG